MGFLRSVCFVLIIGKEQWDGIQIGITKVKKLPVQIGSIIIG